MSARLNAKHIKHVVVMLGWYAEQLQLGIAKYAREAGWALDTLGSRIHRWVPGWKADGIICLLGTNKTVDEYVHAANVPIVNIGYNATLNVPRVATDNHQVAKMAAEYFLHRGFSDLGYYYKNTGPCDRERHAFFRDAAEQAGARFYTIDVSAYGQSLKNSNVRFLALRKHLRKVPKPIAVLVENDDCGIEFITACLEAGLKVPHEVAVLGVNNDKLQCECSPVALSSIDDNMAAVGYAAAELLGRLFRGQRLTESEIMLPPLRVVPRRSTDVTAVKHLIVSEILGKLEKEYLRPLTAEDVASWAPLSQRHLHALFKFETGHSIYQHIMELRMRHAEQLLIETELKQCLVARRSGFSDERHLIRTFRRIRGITPSEYRRSARKRIIIASG